MMTVLWPETFLSTVSPSHTPCQHRALLQCNHTLKCTLGAECPCSALEVWLWHTPVFNHSLSGWPPSMYPPASSTIQADFKGGGVEEIYLSYGQLCPLIGLFLRSFCSLAFGGGFAHSSVSRNSIGACQKFLMRARAVLLLTQHHRGFYGLLLPVECGVIIFLWLFVDIIVPSLLRNLCSENNYYWINCFDNLLILSTLFAFKLNFLLANLMCLLP